VILVGSSRCVAICAVVRACTLHGRELCAGGGARRQNGAREAHGGFKSLLASLLRPLSSKTTYPHNYRSPHSAAPAVASVVYPEQSAAMVATRGKGGRGSPFILSVVTRRLRALRHGGVSRSPAPGWKWYSSARRRRCCRCGERRLTLSSRRTAPIPSAPHPSVRLRGKGPGLFAAGDWPWMPFSLKKEPALSGQERTRSKTKILIIDLSSRTRKSSSVSKWPVPHLQSRLTVRSRPARCRYTVELQAFFTFIHNNFQRQQL